MTVAPDDNSSDGRDPEIARAEAEIARARESVVQSITALQREISRTLDWRDWVRRRPILAVAAAFAVGALVGSRGGGHRKRR